MNDNNNLNIQSEKECEPKKSFTQRIKSKLVKNEVDFFEMFVTGAAISREAAVALKGVSVDGLFNEAGISKIKKAEQKGDKHIHESRTIIDEAFITPIDQTDIVEILLGIEDVTDSIYDVANHMYMLRIKKIDEYMNRFLELLITACEMLHDLMVELKGKRNKSDNNIRKLIIEINALEEQGDLIYMEGMRQLFEYETDPILIVKKKELYQRIEHAIDCCEDVADMIDNILITKV